MQICYKSILLLLTKTQGRWKTVLVVVTSLRGRRLIPGFNSLMPSNHLRLTNHWPSHDFSSLFWVSQVSLKHSLFFIRSQVISVKSELHQVFNTYTHTLWENDWKLSNPNLSHLYTIKKNSCNLFYNKGTVVLLNRALGMCWGQKGRVSFNLYSDYLLSYQIPSEREVKQTASLTHAACHHLHAASWFIPWQQDVGYLRLRRVLQDAWHWSPGGGIHVGKHLNTHTYSLYTRC